ncbi:TetR/AcrR family transcriptional regulator [Butyrivibrio sp. JL13D10]|uniref:TetR/AcrR family transcriptional regulator n=1 Tax=Butyrivibrio sp. JL13D10 TaxID=3236815 RepID=UPI0038B5A7F0
MKITDVGTREKILEAATQEFMINGFADASMRKIAGRVGITATALYRHYKDKEAIFDAVVMPAVQAWEELCRTEEARQTGTARESGLDAMWGDSDQAGLIVELIYKNFKANKLLFCKSEGTKYEDYLHEVVTKVQTATLTFMKEIEDKGIVVNHVDEKEMHLLLSAQYAAMLEMVNHDFSYEEALHYCGTVNTFFKEGWRKFLGF